MVTTMNYVLSAVGGEVFLRHRQSCQTRKKTKTPVALYGTTMNYVLSAVGGEVFCDTDNYRQYRYPPFISTTPLSPVYSFAPGCGYIQFSTPYMDDDLPDSSPFVVSLSWKRNPSSFIQRFMRAVSIRFTSFLLPIPVKSVIASSPPRCS